MLLLACGCYCIRMLSYACLYNPTHVLLIEPLHGVTYAVFMAACTSHAHAIAPKGMGASTQGLLSGLHWGLGQGVGGLLSGFIYQACVLSSSSSSSSPSYIIAHAT